MMNSFGIFAHGVDFDVDAFLSSTQLVPSHVWRRGDVKRHSCIGSRYTNSGVEFLLGDGEALLFHQQDAIATDYLATHRDALRELAQRPGVDTFGLVLQHNAAYECNVIAFGIGLSSRLMWHCLDAGCSLSFNVALKRIPDP